MSRILNTHHTETVRGVRLTGVSVSSNSFKKSWQEILLVWYGSNFSISCLNCSLSSRNANFSITFLSSVRVIRPFRVCEFKVVIVYGNQCRQRFAIVFLHFDTSFRVLIAYLLHTRLCFMLFIIKLYKQKMFKLCDTIYGKYGNQGDNISRWKKMSYSINLEKGLLQGGIMALNVLVQQLPYVICRNHLNALTDWEKPAIYIHHVNKYS